LFLFVKACQPLEQDAEPGLLQPAFTRLPTGQKPSRRA
jgi:hypothetical protein